MLRRLTADMLNGLAMSWKLQEAQRGDTSLHRGSHVAGFKNHIADAGEVFATLALDLTLDCLKPATPGPKLAIKSHVWHAFLEPIRNAEGVSVPADKVIAVPNCPDSIEFLRHQPTGRVGRNHRRGKGDRHA